MKIKKTTNFTANEYEEILKQIGFIKEEIRLYKFSPHLIPEGMEININELPETYCMLVTSKRN